MSGIQIVPFRRRHLPRILEIENACFASEAWPRDEFLAYYADCRDLFLTAKLSGRIAGYMITCVDYRAGGKIAEICSLAVDPGYQRRGVAQALLRHTLDSLDSEGVPKTELAVRTENAAALALYRSFGFRRVRRKRRYYEDGGDAFQMARGNE